MGVIIEPGIEIHEPADPRRILGSQPRELLAGDRMAHEVRPRDVQRIQHCVHVLDQHRYRIATRRMPRRAPAAARHRHHVELVREPRREIVEMWPVFWRPLRKISGSPVPPQSSTSIRTPCATVTNVTACCDGSCQMTAAAGGAAGAASIGLPPPHAIADHHTSRAPVSPSVCLIFQPSPVCPLTLRIRAVAW